jgi:hypothetical protein
MTLLEFLRSLIYDDEARQEFADNPDQALADAGLDHLSAADVHDALSLMQDDSQEADFSRDTDTGGNEINVAPPAPVESHDDGDESAVEYINKYITNNYIDDRDTTVDNSVNQQIDTGGGDFDQNIDIDSTVASGDGAVAAGDDIEDSTITSGDGNTVGDGNVTGDGNTVGDGNTDVNVDGGGSAIVGDGNEAVQGDGNTSSFGSGDANSAEFNGDVSLGDGAALGLGGDVSVDNSDSSTNDSFNDNSDNSTEDSFNDTSSYTDNSDNSTEDSFNDSSSHSESEYSSDDDSFSSSSSHSEDSHDSSDVDYTVDA